MAPRESSSAKAYGIQLYGFLVKTCRQRLRSPISTFSTIFIPFIFILLLGVCYWASDAVHTPEKWYSVGRAGSPTRPSALNLVWSTCTFPPMMLTCMDNVGTGADLCIPTPMVSGYSGFLNSMYYYSGALTLNPMDSHLSISAFTQWERDNTDPTFFGRNGRESITHFGELLYCKTQSGMCSAVLNSHIFSSLDEAEKYALDHSDAVWAVLHLPSDLLTSEEDEVLFTIRMNYSATPWTFRDKVENLFTPERRQCAVHPVLDERLHDPAAVRAALRHPGDVALLEPLERRRHTDADPETTTNAFLVGYYLPPCWASSPRPRHRPSARCSSATTAESGRRRRRRRGGRVHMLRVHFAGSAVLGETLLGRVQAYLEASLGEGSCAVDEVIGSGVKFVVRHNSVSDLCDVVMALTGSAVEGIPAVAYACVLQRRKTTTNRWRVEPVHTASAAVSPCLNPFQKCAYRYIFFVLLYIYLSIYICLSIRLVAWEMYRTGATIYNMEQNREDHPCDFFFFYMMTRRRRVPRDFLHAHPPRQNLFFSVERTLAAQGETERAGAPLHLASAGVRRTFGSSLCVKERIQQETQHKKNANTNNNNNKKHYYCSIFAPVARLVLLPFLLRHKNNSLGLHYSVAPSPFRVNNNNKKTSSSKKNLYGHQQDSFSARTPKAYGWQLPLRADVLWNAKQNNCTCTSLVPPCLSCFSFRSSSPSPKTNQILYHSQRLKSNRYTAPHEIVEVIVQTLTTSPSRRSSDLLLLELFDLYPFITPSDRHRSRYTFTAYTTETFLVVVGQNKKKKIRRKTKQKINNLRRSSTKKTISAGRPPPSPTTTVTIIDIPLFEC
eukprot:gene865-498_t